MDTEARIKELRAKKEERYFAGLALKDFDWWLNAIESASKEGGQSCQDSLRGPWYMTSRRSNEAYCQALSALLGEGFTVALGTGYAADPNMMGDDYTYFCVRVSW